MRFALIAAASLVLAPLMAAPAFAQDALVEEADAGVGVERFDYLEAGQKIELGEGRRLVVSYLRSCWRETIRGGTVTIGREASTLAGGTLERERVQCSGTALRLDPGEGRHSAVMVFRMPAKLASTRSLGGRITVRNVVFGASPILELPGGAKVTIERVDAEGERYDIEVPRGKSAAECRYDMARAGQTLSPGGLYRAQFGTRSILFAVHETAQPGAAAALGRLLRLPPL